MTTVLITGAGGPAGRALGRQLERRNNDGADLVVVGADMAEVSPEGYHYVAQVLAADHVGFIPEMRRLIEYLGADVVIPTVQDELVTIAAAVQILRTSTDRLTRPVVVIGAPGPVHIASDKLFTMWALESAGVPVPAYARTDAFRSTDEVLARLSGPVVVKPRVGRGGRGVTVVDTERDLDWTDLPAGMIVQEFASGTEYAPVVYRSPLTGDSEVVVLEKTGLTGGRVGNATAVRRLGPEERPDVAHLAVRAVEALDLVGPVDVDVRLRESGQPVVLEVNARFGANSEAAPELLDLVFTDYLPEDS